MSSENERLQRELAYLSNLINQHKSSQQGVGTGRAPARDHHVPQRTAEDGGQHHGLRKDSQKPYYGNKKLDLRSSKTLNYQSTNKLSVRSVSAPQSKPVVVRDKAVPTSKVVSVLPNGAQVDTLLSKQSNVSVPKSSSKIIVTGNVPSKQNPGLPPQTKGMSKGLPVSKPNSKRVVLKPGSKIANSVHKTDVIPVTSISQESIEAALSKPSQHAPGLTRADLLRTSIGNSASIPSANHRKVLLPKDKIDAQALISPLTSSQARVRYSSSVPSTVISTAKCNKETSPPDDKRPQVFSGKPSAKSKHYFTDGFGPKKPASSAVKTTEKIEAAQELLNQLKAMKTQNPEGLHPQRHFSAPQLSHVTSQQKHQPYTKPGVMTAGASSQHQTQNRYRKVYSSREVSPLKLSLDRNLFDDSGVPSPIVNLSTSWSGDALPPMVSTPNWLCDRIDGNVNYNPNFSSSSAPKSVHNASVYSSPSKYSLVRNNMASENTTSIVSSRKKSNSENLSTLSRSNLMVVKLRTKYKLVKKAIQTQQRSSFKLRSPQYTVSPRGQPGYRKQMVKNSFRKAGANKWTNTSRYSYNSKSRNLPGFVAHASMNRYALKSPYSPQLQKKSRFAKAKVNDFSYSYSRKYVRAMPSRHIVDRRVNQRTAKSYPTANKKFVMIGGALYQSSRQKLIKASKSPKGGKPYCKRPVNSSRLKTITVRGDDKFTVGRKGKSLRRLSRDKSTENATLVMSISKPPTSAQLVAGRALQRSIHTASRIRYKNKSAKLKGKEYCKFYSRFGRCNRGEKCKFIHDSEKVAVCTRFLRGTCKVTDCPFSHKVAPEKMPVCSYFLKGICSRDNCPYAHVNVNRDAQICQDFVNGFCGLGSKCTKRHSLICREFASTGSCSKGRLCKLKHPLSRKRKRSRCAGSTEEPGLGEPLRKRKRDKSGKGEVKQADDINLPMSERNLPSFISIGGETDESTLVSSGSAADNTLAVGNKQKKMMFIKPRLSFDPADNSLV